MQRHSLPALTPHSPTNVHMLVGKRSTIHLTPGHKLTTQVRTFSSTISKNSQPPFLKHLKNHSKTLPKLTAIDQESHEPLKIINLKITSNQIHFKQQLKRNISALNHC